MTPELVDVLEGRARWCVVQGDALDVMDTIPSDVIASVVTDPPYCSGAFSETGRKQANGQGLRSETLRQAGWFTNDAMGTAGIAWLLRAVATETHRVCAPGTASVFFTDWRMVPNVAPAMESSGMRFHNLVVWDKGTAGLGAGFRCQHELLLEFAKGTPKFHSASLGNVLRVPRVNRDERAHQTEKPVALMEQVLSVVALPDGIVLDPFCGSGTTGVACLRLGRRFIGIEKDEKYAAIARERLTAEGHGQSLHEYRAGQLSLLEDAR